MPSPHTPYSMLQCSVKDHRMIVLKDEGLYRHVRFQEPGTSIWRFDLVTWPGHLVITGDLQDFHFARISDMFEFFRTKQPGEINEHYWAEKLKGPVKTKSFSAARYKQMIFESFRERQSYSDLPGAGLWKAIREELLDDAEVLDESEAHRRLNEFRYVYPSTAHRTVFEFTDSWEWDLREWDWHFRLSLHAIVWGIRQWDTAEHKTEADWLREDLSKIRKDLVSTQDYLKKLGDDEKGHIVRIDGRGFFNSKHPLHERADDELLDCSIHTVVTEWLDTMSFAERRDKHDTVWRVRPAGEHNLDANWIWEKIG